MHRALIALAALVAMREAAAMPPPQYLAPAKLSVTVQGEHRIDAVDYEEEARAYYRGKLIMRFSRTSALYGAYVAVEERNGPDRTGEDDSRRSYTWSLAVRDASPYVALYVGNYYVNFGSGLLIGGWMPSNPDVFFSRDAIPRRETFAPCTSGNPLYAYRGGALALRTPGEGDVIATLHPFYSSKERYLDPKTADSGATNSSIVSMDYKYEQREAWSRPVELVTWGAAAALHIIESFLLQAHYVNTGVSFYSGDALEWDRDAPGNDDRGIVSLDGYGALAEYRDRFVRIFVEHDRTRRLLRGDDGARGETCGAGSVGGLQFRHPLVSLSIIGKSTDADYYAPFQSSVGARSPEEAWFVNAAVELARGLALGGAVSSQRPHLLAPGERECAAVIRERVSLRYIPSDRLSVELAGRRYEGRERGEEREREQAQGNALAWPWESCGVSARALFQRQDGREWSDLLGGGIAVRWRRRVECALEYAKARIGGENRLYAVVSPLGGANIPGIFIEETSHVAAARLRITWPPVTLAARYLYQFTDEAPLRTRMEFFASVRL
ncbi:MAG TPA: hypothetical protein PLG31_00760 [Spirochaetota bacterium]|nr:hypothetical protein [Spirochaetota bacterium]